MSQENVEIVRDALTVWIEVDEGLVDPGRLNEFLAPDDWSYSAKKILDAGANRVVATFYQRGKLRGSESWVEMRYGILYTVEEGLITRVQGYATSEDALEAVGLSE